MRTAFSGANSISMQIFKCFRKMCAIETATTTMEIYRHTSICVIKYVNKP